MFNKQLVTTEKEVIKALTEGKCVIIFSPDNLCYLHQLDDDSNPVTWGLMGKEPEDKNVDDCYWSQYDNETNPISIFDLLSIDNKEMYIANRFIGLGDKDDGSNMSYGEIIFALRDGHAIVVNSANYYKTNLIQFNDEGKLIIFKEDENGQWVLDPETSLGILLERDINSSEITTAI